MLYVIIIVHLMPIVYFFLSFQVDEIFNVPGTGPVVGGTLER